VKVSYLLSAVVALLSILLIRADRELRRYDERIRMQAGRLGSLRAEHNYFLLPAIGHALSRPMLVAEDSIVDSLPDGLYVRALSTCGPCQLLHDSLVAGKISASFVLEETREMLANTSAGTQSRLPMLTGATGGFMERVPDTGTPGIVVVRHGRIVAFETGVVSIAELEQLATMVR